MKRGLVFSLCALALVAGATAAQAQSTVDLSLNLRYNDPADPSEGGTFYLVAKTNSANGIAGISAYISNISLASVVFGNNGTAGNGYAAVSAATLGADIAEAADFSGVTNIVYGQDLAGSEVFDVGGGAGTAGNIAVDPLRNTAWNNAALIASGTFGATRPAFTTSGANSTGANVYASETVGAAAVQATVTTTVRGDSLRTLNLESPAGAGLRAGDANRDGVVNVQDFSLLSSNYLQNGTTWGQGNFNDDNSTNVQDFSLLSSNYLQTSTPPAIAAVPEPTGVALLGIGLLALGFRAKRG